MCTLSQMFRNFQTQRNMSSLSGNGPFHYVACGTDEGHVIMWCDGQKLQNSWVCCLKNFVYLHRSRRGQLLFWRGLYYYTLFIYHRQ